VAGQPANGHGQGTEPGRGPGLPGRTPGAPGPAGVPDPAVPDPAMRDPGVAGFAKGGVWDLCPPSAALAAAAEEASGPEWRCPGASDRELMGLLCRWAAIESWAAAAKLGVIREMMRREDQPWLRRGWHGDLPDVWSESLQHELAAGLAVSAPSADRTAWLAWELGARLPGIAALLADGTLTYAKARLIAEEFRFLSDDGAARAEAMILDQLPGKTYAQVVKLAARAACTVDPDSVEKRRKHAEKEDARVRFWREQSGAAALTGRDLPTDETLAAHANVNARAQQYQESGAFPDARMDQLRAMAYLDLLNGVTPEARTAHALANSGVDASPHTGDRPGDANPDPTDDGGGPDDRGPDDGRPDDSGPGGGAGPADGQPSEPGQSPAVLPAPPALADLVFPLATLLGLAERPGEGHDLGPLDPDLCRDLAALAAGSPRSEWCVTVTDPGGIAIGHGCGRPDRAGRPRRPATAARPVSAGPQAALPARVNLTSTLATLRDLASRDAPRPAAAWAFTPGGPSPPGGYGIWTLTLPGGREFTVRLGPVPTFECDHQHESHAYQPNDTLRHLIQVRDGTCTFPPCSRHARESDFEHATPYDKGGRTCACNAGARSRKCHRVKQSRGWSVTQPRPGWHQWTTPSGHTYTQEPKRHPT
jgi:hypothetical protein